MMSTTWELRVLFDHFLISNQMTHAAIAYTFYNECRSLQSRTAALYQSLAGKQKGSPLKLQRLVIAPALAHCVSQMNRCQPVFSAQAWNETQQATTELQATHARGELMDLDSLSLAFRSAIDDIVVFLEQYVQLFKHYLLALQRALQDTEGGLSVEFTPPPSANREQGK